MTIEIFFKWVLFTVLFFAVFREELILCLLAMVSLSLYFAMDGIERIVRFFMTGIERFVMFFKKLKSVA